MCPVRYFSEFRPHITGRTVNLGKHIGQPVALLMCSTVVAMLGPFHLGRQRPWVTGPESIVRLKTEDADFAQPEDHGPESFHAVKVFPAGTIK